MTNPAASPHANDGPPGSLGCKTRFEGDAVKVVIHCHGLRHEDHGTVQTAELIS